MTCGTCANLKTWPLTRGRVSQVANFYAKTAGGGPLNLTGKTVIARIEKPDGSYESPTAALTATPTDGTIVVTVLQAVVDALYSVGKTFTLTITVINADTSHSFRVLVPIEVTV